jgi:hypothetical protein
MYRKLIAVALALALIGTGGTAVMADNGANAVVADFDQPQELSPNPNGELEDGGSDDDGGGGGGELESALGISDDLTDFGQTELTPV